MKITLLYDLTFRVESQTRKDIVHVVDLVADTCTCESWICRLSKAEDVQPSERRCKHIKECREKLVDLVINEMKDGQV
jgi:hypothetical protein